MADFLQYHLAELSTARDPSHPGHCLPRLESHHRRILDIGCGMGQTLLALDMPAQVEAHGIDVDSRAIDEGQKLMPGNIHLRTGTGERLPFENGYFDLVICRVALPYMQVTDALKEIGRVTAPGGDAWLMMHPAAMYTRRAWLSLRRGKLKDVVYCGFVLLNGVVLSVTGKQMRWGQRTETFQTGFGMKTAMERVGFQSIVIETEPFFIAKGRKV